MKPPPADQKNEENTENASKSNNSLAARDFCESKRGIGCLFGERALTAFLTQNNIKRVVRGHECVFEGYRLSFNEKLITVFSASNYCGYQNNNGAVMIFDSQNNYKFDTYSIERDIESGQAIVQQPQPGKKKYSGKRSSNMKSVKLFGAPPKASIRKWNSDLEDTNNQLSLKVKSFNINKGNIITRRQKVCSIQPSSVKFSMSSPEVRLQDIEFNLT
ncbi:hypothetical protein TRFO_15457 [Tritrichomonas foetus]|uniref:Serine/threonine specific protein phosphatases domain-containing protein n=1 Tax=Tritrichomonas foetus TaxID=1144522 RepID=A0A1J4KXJ6_9EUKA|nr:hypothetical protein TRFO_15457 [Tritrichomonas foetus]|eukprot:OHT14277.1 hypothetical protein TRFO_15457 [Tritrichomonas foetus]